MWHIESQLINHRLHDRARHFTQTTVNQEIKFQMGRNAPRPRRKHHLGGGLIFWRRKPFELCESRLEAVAVTVRFRTSRFASVTAAQTCKGIHCVPGIRGNSKRAPPNHSHVPARSSDSTWPFNSSVLREVLACARSKCFPTKVSLRGLILATVDLNCQSNSQNSRASGALRLTCRLKRF